MPIPYVQDIAGCLAEAIGDGGLPADSLDEACAAADNALANIQAEVHAGRLPMLTIGGETGDLDEIRRHADRLREACDDVAVIGIGGSSLGAETLCAVAPDDGPRIHFLANPDPVTVERFWTRIDLARLGVLAVSKSGGTAETLSIAMAILPRLAAAVGPERLAERALAITEPGDSALRKLAGEWSLPVLDHHTGIGGRYSALTNVGLMPAAIAGLDIAAARAGAQAVAGAALAAEGAEGVPAAVGAAVSLALARVCGARDTVLLPYADALAPFARWYGQLWAESLGKQGFGTTPVAALGPVDQHSQLQLWLDGPPDKMYTVLLNPAEGAGPVVDPALAGRIGTDYLAGRTLGDLLVAEQRGTVDSLQAAGRPVRTLALARIDGEAVGALMMHYMLETIVAAGMLGIDAFDQPAVEDGKVRARAYLAESAPPG